jgi:hypothetical protein
LKINHGNFVLLVILAAASMLRAGIDIQLAGNSAINGKALTFFGTYGPSINGESFQQFPIVSANGWQYVAYYDDPAEVVEATANF